jgi:FkbM family methyltransferase
MKPARKAAYFVRTIGLRTTFYRMLRRALDTLMQRTRPTLDGDASVQLLNGGTLELNPSDRGFSVDIVLGGGLREPLASRYLLEHLPEQGTLVDLGANIGYYTVLLSDKFDRVLSIEPTADSFEHLERNVRVNRLDEKVRTLRAAVTGEGGYAHIASHENRNWARISRDGGGERVPAVTLAWLAEELGSIDMIKMDVEGHEGELITSDPAWWKERGPRYLFYEHHMNLFSPGENVQILEVLQAAGYRVEVAFDEINPPVSWRSGLLRRVHESIRERALHPKRREFYRDEPLDNVIADTMVLDGRYGSVEFILRKD